MLYLIVFNYIPCYYTCVTFLRTCVVCCCTSPFLSGLEDFSITVCKFYDRSANQKAAHSGAIFTFFVYARGSCTDIVDRSRHLQPPHRATICLFYAPLWFPLYFINGSFLACELVLAILRLGVPYCFLLSNLFSSQMFGDLPAAFVYVYMFYNFTSFLNKWQNFNNQEVLLFLFKWKQTSVNVALKSKEGFNINII